MALALGGRAARCIRSLAVARLAIKLSSKCHSSLIKCRARQQTLSRKHKTVNIHINKFFRGRHAARGGRCILSFIACLQRMNVESVCNLCGGAPLYSGGAIHSRIGANCFTGECRNAARPQIFTLMCPSSFSCYEMLLPGGPLRCGLHNPYIFIYQSNWETQNMNFLFLPLIPGW